MCQYCAVSFGAGGGGGSRSVSSLTSRQRGLRNLTKLDIVAEIARLQAAEVNMSKHDIAHD